MGSVWSDLLAETAALDARLLQQLAVLLLRHALATLLDDRTHAETFHLQLVRPRYGPWDLVSLAAVQGAA